MTTRDQRKGRSFDRKLRSKFLALSLAPLMAAGVVASTSSVAQAAEFSKASCQVHAILANREGEGGVPENLAFLKAELTNPAFAAFKSFVLLGTHRFALSKGKETTQKLASGHTMALAMRAADEKNVKLHVRLGQASGKSLVDTDYTIKPNGFVLFATNHAKGSVVFAVQCHGKN